MSTTIVVTDEQVDAAPTLVAIKGGLDKVTPLIRKIAEARPRAEAVPDAARGSRASAES